MFSVARRYWKWNAIQTWLVWGALIAVNGALLVASSLKFLEGGFIPLGIGVVSSS
jgi:K+ transporter